MPYRCLSDFLEDLGHAGELTRVEEEVDPALEVAEITARSAESGGAALLFGAVKGHDLPVATNLLATEGRICRALDIASLAEISERLARLLDVSAPEGWFERIKAGAQPAALGGVLPRKVRAAACQQIVRLGSDIDLGELPLLQSAAEETSRTISSAVVFSAEPDSHRPVCGRFDLQRIDRSRLAVCWAAYDEHARLLDEYRVRQRKMPVAVVIGGDPAFQLAAAAPLPEDSNVCALAGLLREKPIDVVAGRGVDLEVPAEAEIVIEGFVDPAEPPVTVGPMCAPLGHCTRPRPAPAMQVTAVTHRANPIFAAFVPGRPPHEFCTVARSMQRAFLPLLRLVMPELVDFDLPEFAAARHWAAVSIRKTYPSQGRRSAHAAWGLRPMMFAKTLVVVDAEVDVRDRDQVLAAIVANFRPGQDVVTERGPADPFDPATPTGSLSERMAIDATRKLT
ncbi:MAG: UbiD family decarboxylase [Planctomycetes bacterium]|nr:UbiD family decarboxylase [Planctomycetota bacterium]MCG2684746.1 UbiD family decarboxylase [Planctomycetales bacterium]